MRFPLSTAPGRFEVLWAFANRFDVHLCSFPPRLHNFLRFFDNQCFCGTADEFENAVESDQCGKTYPTLCTGDATRACGGFGAISVFERTSDAAPAPAPVPAPTPTTLNETTYSIMGCFADSKADRIMENMMVENVMSAKVSWWSE